MKKSIYLLGALMLATTGCSSDYLDQSSVGANTDDSVIFDNLDNVKMAINGIALLQTSQYFNSSYSSGTQGLNGEGTLKTWYNEYTGQDYTKCSLTGWASIMNFNNHNSATSMYTLYPWFYCYTQVVNANLILNRIDEIPGDENVRNLYKAQTLVYRAYAYSNLVKFYSRRWSDRQGESRGVVLRLEPTADPMQASSLKTVYAQIYEDLDLAISLFTTAKQNGVERAASDKWLPNIDVAYAVYSRAALNREDWNTALEMAKNVMANNSYKVMGTADYTSGFNTANKEWIWEAYNDASQTIHYYGFFAYNASNSSASACRNYPIAISRELINQIPAEDSRLELFGIPTEAEIAEFTEITGNGFNSNTTAVTKGEYYTRIKADYKSKLYTTTLIFPYMSFKFQANAGSAGDGELCLFRKAEMLYNAAEAAYMLNKQSEAVEYLVEAVEPYQEGYTCSKTGEDLLNEIKLYRRFDLFGEGFSWYDCKRWGIPMVRHTWDEGGNYASQMAGSASVSTNGNYGPSDKNNWTWVYPKDETDFNNLVTTFEPENWTEGM
ncbi:MAG: RagB/SusD family nutrient uptake outer membrane protein [Muribaculaceae bacterium]|nr:RagB/SusD family nutrient uptake outer membrane protein [Muribaculaceae bacterium]